MVMIMEHGYILSARTVADLDHQPIIASPIPFCASNWRSKTGVKEICLHGIMYKYTSDHCTAPRYVLFCL